MMGHGMSYRVVLKNGVCYTQKPLEYGLVELGCYVLLKTPINQNGTMAEDAFFMEQFISAESVR